MRFGTPFRKWLVNIVAVIKHIAIKNSNYNAASDYLTTKHDEFTSKPILDENGRRIPRDEYIIEGINCDPYSFGAECQDVNARFGKNQRKEEIKAHHYIISFDPKDRDENGLTAEHAQAMGMAFARENFPGHQILVCTHPDGHGNAGNIHVHIVLNSVRAFDVPEREFMERPADHLVGNKHHVTKDLLEYLKKKTMEMCQGENLNQVNLLTPAKVRITDKEYWAQRRGQRNLDAQNTAEGKPLTKYETQNMILRKQILSTMMDSKSLAEFEQKLLSNYGIQIQESRGQFSYHLPDRARPIRGKTLGTDFQKKAILSYFAVGYRIASDPQIHAVSDPYGTEKSRSNEFYARFIKKDNLKQMARSMIFLQEHGLTETELNERFELARDDLSSLTSRRKELEQEIKQLKSANYAMKQYLETKKIHTQYLQAKDKKKFREEHSSPLSIYDASTKELRSIFGKEKFPSRKELQERLTAAQAEYHTVYEDFCAARNRHNEIRDLRTNYYELVGQEQHTPERETTPFRTEK